MSLRNKLFKATTMVIAWAPFEPLRRWMLNLVPGYRIASSARIGWGVVVAVNRFECGECVVIRRGNCFMGPFDVELADEVFIGRGNRFECGDSAAAPSQAHKGYARRLIVGRKALINDSHLFDLLGEIRIGEGSWVAGFQSQFLTHGAGAMERDIRIGSGCFIGSAVRFAPGSGVGDACMVGMGSVVTKQLYVDNAVIAGVPARFLRHRASESDYRFEKDW
jgi:acetyltransferase-like isoleucine patch superfamily enzyme